VAWLNFIPSAMSVNQGMMHTFAWQMDTGRTLSATSTPTSGDPDLYLWGPGSGWLDTSLNAGTVPDSVSATTSGQGLYGVFVYGWTTARYGLSVSGPALLAQDFAPSRDPIGLPALPTGHAPPQALPTAPTGYRIYLPSALR
jgi:hypothetical protein